MRHSTSRFTRDVRVTDTCPQYCRVTPTECVSFFGNPVSSTVQAWIGPFCLIAVNA